MNTQSDEQIPENDSSENIALATATDAVTTLVAGVNIPAPIRRNVFKAFDRLCSAAIDIPVSYLEGKSAEKRAETQARIKLIATSADQIATQMNVEPEYAHLAVKKFGQKVLREQINLDKTCEVAANQILHEVDNAKGELEESNEKTSINDDWLNNFEKEASLKSTEEMQMLFGRILAGEIQNPSSFSIKTVKLLARLDNQVAELFQRFCSLCIYIEDEDEIHDARVVSLGGNAGSNSLKDYGLSFAKLNILHEYGLIIPDYNSWSDYSYYVVSEENQVNFPFKYENQNWAFLPLNDRTKDQELRLNGVALSNSGKELLKILDIEPNEKYKTALEEYFKSINVEMTEVETP